MFKLLKHAHLFTEMVDLMLNVAVLVLLVCGIFGGSIVVYTRIDPFQSFSMFFGLKLSAGVRLFLVHFAIMECTRSYSLILLPILTIFKVHFAVLDNIYSLPASGYAIRKYTQLQCISKRGYEGIRLIAGTLMTVGFGICVVGLWVVIHGWKMFPPIYYLMVSLCTLIVYTMVFLTLPVIVKINKLSQDLLNVHWKRLGMDKGLVWKKQLRAQCQISFYYGSARFDDSTETNFYNSIIENTVNVILLF